MCHIVIRNKKSDDDDEPERKERVIHTRVPESLETELRQRAQSLGISVSNLVRNVLGHAFGLVGDIMADGARVARAARGEGGQVRGSAGAGAGAGAAAATVTATPVPTGEATGWQPLVMGKNAVCGPCNTIIPRGTDAAIAIVDGPGPRPVVCSTCLEELRDDQRNDDEPRSRRR